MTTLTSHPHIRDKVALLISGESPFMKAAREATRPPNERRSQADRRRETTDAGEDETSEREKVASATLQNQIYGSRKTLVSWLHREVDPNSFHQVCAAFNSFRKLHRSSLESVSKQLESTDLTDDKVDRYTFAEKLGYARNRWDDVLHHIDNVLFAHNVMGREHKCTAEQAQVLTNKLAGVHFVYFTSISFEDEPILIRATLRVRRAVQVQKDISYVPCALKMPYPTTDPRSERFGKSRTYIGKVCEREGYQYFSLADDEERRDFLNFTVHLGTAMRDYYDGLLHSLSVRDSLYASALVLEHRNRQIGSLETPQDTTDFMNQKPKACEDGLAGARHFADEASPNLCAYLAKALRPPLRVP